MANRFWVGGTGNWDLSTTTHWSATSGGVGGASVPTSVDNVYFDSLSFTTTGQIVTVSAAVSCLDMDWTGALNNPTLAGSQGISINGNFKTIAAMTWSNINGITFAATTTGKTITTNGLVINSYMVFDGIGGGWTLQDNLVITKDFNLNNGAINTGNKNINCTRFNTNNTTTTRSITFGSSTVTCSDIWQTNVTTGLTLSMGTSTIVLAGNTTTFAGGGLAYNNIVFQGTPITILDSNTFSSISVSAGCILKITSGTTQTVTSITSSGVKGNRATIQALTASSAATISTGSAISASHLTVQDITKAGAGSITFRSSLPVSGNTGIAFSDRYWIAGTGNTSATASWAYVSGGSGGAAVPTSADSVYFDSASFNGAGQIVTVDVAANCLDMDWTGALNSPSFSVMQNFSVFGSLTLNSSMISSGSSTISIIMKSTTTGNTITTNGVTIKNSINFSGVGGVWTLQDDLTTIGANVYFIAGTLNTNNKNVSCVNPNFLGSGVKGLTLGSSVMTVTSDVSFSTITNLTFDAGTSTIKMTGNAKTFDGGGLTYNKVEFQGTPTTITGSNTFNTLTIAAGKTAKLTSGTTQTVTSLVCNGTTASPSTLQAVTTASAATITLPSGRYFIRHTSVKDITITGATAVTSIAGTNVSGNTGITFVTKFEMGRIKNDGSFNWYSTATGTVTKVSG